MTPHRHALLLASVITAATGVTLGSVVSLAAQEQGRRFSDVELHDRFDANADGRLDRAERDLARKEAESRPPRRRRGGPARAEERPESPRPETIPDALKIDPDDLRQTPRHEGTGLYDRDVLHTIFLRFEADDWHDEMVAFHGTDVEVPATLLLDGRPIGEVGVSYRGNTSFDMPAKKSFGISIDAYDDDLRIDERRTLNLLNANGDQSMMREVLFSNIASDHIPAPEANFVRVVVNGTYLGVYGNVEQINKDFTKRHHDTRGGVRWKVPPDFSGGGALAYHGPDREEYADKYELKTGSAGPEDWDALIELCRILKETPDEEMEETLPKHLDVSEAIRFLALDNAFVDSDGYYSRGSDYYVYMDPDGIFHLIHYDNNETFGRGRRSGPGGRGGPDGRDAPGGRGGRGGPPQGLRPDGPPPGFEPGEPPADLDADRRGRNRSRDRGMGRGDRGRDRNQRPGGRGPGRGGPGRQGGGMTQAPLALADESDTRPVIARILAVDAWRAEYIETLRTIAENDLDWANLKPRIDAYRTLIEKDVIRDPFHGDRTGFRDALFGGEASIKAFAAERRRFLLDHPSLDPDRQKSSTSDSGSAGDSKAADRSSIR